MKIRQIYFFKFKEGLLFNFNHERNKKNVVKESRNSKNKKQT